MDLTLALPTFLVTLREGVEAALVVGIVLACLAKAQQSRLNPWVYGGIGAGVVGSGLLGGAIALGVTQLSQSLPGLEPLIKPLVNTLFGAIAIVLLSWMLLWMTRQARALKGELEGAVGTALRSGTGAGWSLFSLVGVAVLREGIETVLFIFSSVQQSSGAVVGAIAGLLGATAIGFGLFRWGVKINLRQFFQVMGICLLVIVGGLVVSLGRNLDATLVALTPLLPEAHLCWFQQSCLLGPLLWDASQWLPDRQFPGILLKTLAGYRDHLYLVQAIAYGLFWITIGSRYFQALGPQKPLQTIAKD